ncbi:low molecular weight phosphotyrosine protein phosphatase [Paracoccus sp. S1E-3]|uniref:low molecular weight protein-tyrosine-phosphatase n=2 Tax=Paracoccus TaxID=265 RepID=UPI0015EF8845|nr:low molecular weight protein-tyrosine-phosphatase [Paracoccus sp. S1E-3]MBA4489186.1 low molecular weight phosphotyrosine protein phosphatase [Paracoccus sp. S1E-3]
MSTPSVLFVCLGNICRSPLAEGALRAVAARAGVTILIDSAGTGNWHVGDAPDPRAQAVAARHGVDISALRARQVRAEDFHRFDHIVAMDRDNLAELRRLAPADAPARLSLMLDHVPGRKGKSVADPYFGDASGFGATWEEVLAGAEGLLDRITQPRR